MVTAGTIKRPLPCPVKGDRKQSIFWRVKGKKTEQEEKKKIRKKIEKKRKEN